MLFSFDLNSPPKELASEATQALFGEPAIASHLFVLAVARDINADHSSETLEESGGGAGEDHRQHAAPSSSIRDYISNSSNQADEASLLASRPKDKQQGTDEAEGRRGVKLARGSRRHLQNRTEELKGGSTLRRLKPLLDSFIHEDTYRTGALPAEVFRRVLVVGHGGLWSGLGAPKAGFMGTGSGLDCLGRPGSAGE